MFAKDADLKEKKVQENKREILCTATSVSAVWKKKTNNLPQNDKNAYENFCKEVDKLKRKATKINKTLDHVMFVIMTRIKPRKK